MNNIIKDQNIEDILSSSTQSSSFKKEMMNTEKRVWNQLQHSILNNNPKDITAAKRETRNFWSRNYTLLLTSFLMLLLLASATAAIYTYSNRKQTNNIAQNIQNGATITPLITPTSKEIKDLNDFYPLAAERLAELAGVSKDEVNDLIQNKLKEDTNRASDQKVFYTKSEVILAKKYEGEGVGFYHSKVNQSKPITIEQWESTNYRKRLISQNDTIIELTTHTPQKSANYQIAFSEHGRITTYTQELPLKKTDPATATNPEANALKKLLISKINTDNNTIAAYEQVTLKELKKVEGKTLLTLEYNLQWPPTDPELIERAVPPIKDIKAEQRINIKDIKHFEVLPDNSVRQSKIETYDESGKELAFTTHTIESKTLDFNKQYFEQMPSNITLREEKLDICSIGAGKSTAMKEAGMCQ